MAESLVARAANLFLLLLAVEVHNFRVKRMHDRSPQIADRSMIHMINNSRPPSDTGFLSTDADDELPPHVSTSNLSKPSMLVEQRHDMFDLTKASDHALHQASKVSKPFRGLCVILVMMSLLFSEVQLFTAGMMEQHARIRYRPEFASPSIGRSENASSHQVRANTTRGQQVDGALEALAEFTSPTSDESEAQQTLSDAVDELWRPIRERFPPGISDVDAETLFGKFAVEALQSGIQEQMQQLRTSLNGTMIEMEKLRQDYLGPALKLVNQAARSVERAPCIGKPTLNLEGEVVHTALTTWDSGVASKVSRLVLRKPLVKLATRWVLRILSKTNPESAAGLRLFFLQLAAQKVVRSQEREMKGQVLAFLAAMANGLQSQLSDTLNALRLDKKEGEVSDGGRGPSRREDSIAD